MRIIHFKVIQRNIDSFASSRSGPRIQTFPIELDQYQLVGHDGCGDLKQNRIKIHLFQSRRAYLEDHVPFYFEKMFPIQQYFELQQLVNEYLDL